MWDIQIRGIDFYHILNWFFIYSFLGWLWESSYVSAKEKRLVNRGFVTGPVCTIYGFGAVIVYLILKPISGNIILLYLGGVIVPTILEYLTAVLMEHTFHTSWWDYSKNKFNFQGRICLGASLGWGAFSVILFHVFQPAVDWIVSRYTVATGKLLVTIAVLVYAVDFGMSFMNALQIGEKLHRMDELLEEIHAHVHSTKLYESVEEHISSLQSRYEQLKGHGNLFVRRTMNAYPHMRSRAQALRERAERRRNRK